MRINRSALSTMIVAGLAFAACGGSDSPESEDAGVATEATAEVTTTEAPTTSTPTETAPVTVAPTTEAPTTTQAPTTTISPYIYEGSHASVDGWSYRFQVASEGPDPRASFYGCNETAPPGRTNLILSVTVTNELTDRSAPGPYLSFVSNMNEDRSAVDPAVVDDSAALEVQGLFGSGIEVSPQVGQKQCGLGNTTATGDPSDRGTIQIPAGGSQVYEVHLGGVPDPVPEGIVLYACLADSCDITIPL